MRFRTVSVILLTAIVSVSATLLIAAAPASPGATTTWEYECVTAQSQTMDQPNKLGSEGWELVSVVSGQQGLRSRFKTAST